MIPFLLIALLLLWRTQGGLLFACAMWVLAFLYMRRLPPRLKGLPVAWLSVLLGMLCNAIVTVANGGYMPVKGLPPSFRPLFPTWIPARSANYLVFLADQHYLLYFSIGDVLIISGVLLWFVGPWLLRCVTRLRAPRAEVQVADTVTNSS
ncbi:MAG TPA: DUF5317 family protein [Chthoniobacterales bacterium]|jgi:hypothetical protein|nr:DUF5317 family protein [Chthoniobacterales bacterium]